jgi:RND superfamily putative drug exporter
VIKTVGATGGVITSAGLIFAASMLALTVSSLATVVQLGFVIGVGLLLDTFIVRTITVPAVAVLIGDKNWWPSKTPRQMLDAKRQRGRAQDRDQADPSYDGSGDGPTTRRTDPDLDAELDADDGYAAAVQTASRISAAWRDD